MKISPAFNFKRHSIKLDVLMSTKLHSFESALQIGWEKPLFDFNVLNLDNSFQMQKWSTDICEESTCKFTNLTHDIECYGGATGRPLIPACNILAAVETGTNCGKNGYIRFANIQTEEVQTWLYEILAPDKRKKYPVPEPREINLYAQINDDIFLENCDSESLRSFVITKSVLEETQFRNDDYPELTTKKTNKNVDLNGEVGNKNVDLNDEVRNKNEDRRDEDRRDEDNLDYEETPENLYLNKTERRRSQLKINKTDSAMKVTSKNAENRSKIIQKIQNRNSDARGYKSVRYKTVDLDP